MKEQVTNFTGTMWAGLTAAFTGFMNFIPALLGALLIMVAGWFVAKFVGSVIERVLKTIKLEQVAESANISGYLPHYNRGKRSTVSSFIGTIAKWFIFLIFVQAAVITLGIEQLTGVINSIILFIPNIMVAAVILVAGAWAAKFVSGLVEASTARINLGKTNTLGALTRYGILGFAFIAAVSQLGIATNLINILFTGLVGSLALAFGLAFGLGGQSVASDITRSLLDRTRSAKVIEPNVDDQLSHH